MTFFAFAGSKIAIEKRSEKGNDCLIHFPAFCFVSLFLITRLFRSLTPRSKIANFFFSLSQTDDFLVAVRKLSFGRNFHQSVSQGEEKKVAKTDVCWRGKERNRKNFLSSVLLPLDLTYISLGFFCILFQTNALVAISHLSIYLTIFPSERRLTDIFWMEEGRKERETIWHIHPKKITINCYFFCSGRKGKEKKKKYSEGKCMKNT